MILACLNARNDALPRDRSVCAWQAKRFVGTPRVAAPVARLPLTDMDAAIDGYGDPTAG